MVSRGELGSALQGGVVASGRCLGPFCSLGLPGLALLRFLSRASPLGLRGLRSVLPLPLGDLSGRRAGRLVLPERVGHRSRQGGRSLGAFQPLSTAEPLRLGARSWQGWIWPNKVSGHGVDVAACAYTQDRRLFPCEQVLQQPEQDSSPHGVPGGLSTLPPVQGGPVGLLPPSLIPSLLPSRRKGSGTGPGRASGPPVPWLRLSCPHAPQ